MTILETGLYRSGWCGNLRYKNNKDCEFRIFVTNPQSDILYNYNRVIKAPSDLKESRYKDIEFEIRHSRDISIHYIPVNVPEDTRIRFYFKNYSSCL